MTRAAQEDEVLFAIRSRVGLAFSEKSWSWKFGSDGLRLNTNDDYRIQFVRNDDIP
jgi:hypothetical protein